MPAVSPVASPSSQNISQRVDRLLATGGADIPRCVKSSEVGPTSRSLHVQVDPAAVSMIKALEAAARTEALVVVTGRAYLDLVRELGSDRAVVRRLLRIAEKVGKPIGVNAPTPSGSRTYFVAPRGWTIARLKGWVGARHAELEATFGQAEIAEERAS